MFFEVLGIWSSDVQEEVCPLPAAQIGPSQSRRGEQDLWNDGSVVAKSSADPPSIGSCGRAQEEATSGCAGG